MLLGSKVESTGVVASSIVTGYPSKQEAEVREFLNGTLPL